MTESLTYQMILEEGRKLGEPDAEARGRAIGAIEQGKKVLRIQGDDAFGLPDPQTVTLIDQIRSLADYDRLLKRVRTAATWQELLESLPTRRRASRKSPS